jgi:hypothetical protein
MIELRTGKPGQGMTYSEFISHASEADLSASLPYSLRPGRCTGHFFDSANNLHITLDMGVVICRPARQYLTVPLGQKRVAVLVPLQLIPDSGTF